MDIGTLVRGMQAEWAEERSEEHLTLGGMIEVLETMPGDLEIEGIEDELDSFRGYYSDLAFEPKDGKTSVRRLLAACRDAMGKVFIGYKGGEFGMTAKTPLWIATYGSSVGALKILGLDSTGKLETATDDD